ncbi:MAG TPA: 50S ribosomal protein L25 [Candidatus Kapabacteria bacterium]|jgi:large subunit ribosomal protein L25|nr:50S ribosomal protein L25 [Candidatus Kapabacteria bacterium]HPP38862.1 50S ribosomal protein L25 [Candidatus Kapabacteria bacterium]HPU23322.1 50S ribosomal protein L25 [Candidatus Kapabacteria bacterium]
MKEIILKVKKREVGKTSLNKIRKEGLIPGVYYINGEPGIPVATDFLSLRNIVYTSSTKLIKLQIEGEEQTKDCVLKDVKFHPVTDQILHFDLLGLNPVRKLTVEVPVIVKGQSVGVRKGGKLQQSLHKVTIKCLPQHLVDALEVDVTNLDLGKSLHIRDLSLEGIEFVVPGDTIIVVCKVPRGVQISAEANA